MTDRAPDRPIGKTLDGIRELYAGSLVAYGPGAKSVGWKDEASHLLRFDRLVRIVDRTGSPGSFTVNDWGCGYGALFRYLEDRFGADLDRYTGYEISEEMLSAASRAVVSPKARFVLGSRVTEDADYSFVSGTFNVRLQATDAEWDRYVKDQLEDIYARSRRGMAFNLLTSYVDWKQETLFYADPGEFFAFCKRRLSRYVTLIHDNALYEWTMLVDREPRG